MSKRQPAFVGLDLETTGLDPHTGVILELGMVTFDHALQPIAARSWLTNELTDHDVWMAPAVEDMHEASGLLMDLIFGTHPSLTEVEDHALWWLRDNQAEGLPMLGSSVTFDRNWLAVHAPRLLAKFHYHSLDATSVKLAALSRVDNNSFIELTTGWIDTRAGLIRSHHLHNMKVDSEQQTPHRVLYDICASAALATASLEMIERGTPQ